MVRTQFRLGSRELGQLTELVRTATRIRRPPDFGTAAPLTEYIIFAKRRVFETLKGDVPRQLAELTGNLSGLIDRYA